MTALLQIGDFVEFVAQPVMAAPMPKVWFLLRVHPNHDIKAERQLHARGVSAYVPKEKRKVRTTWNRIIEKELPIFSGALFIPDFDAQGGVDRLKAIASGIGGFVKRGDEALQISLSWMAKIRALEARMQPTRKFRVGQQVRIVGGAWDLWEGRIIRLDRKYRIRVLIASMMGEVPLDLDEDQVEAV